MQEIWKAIEGTNGKYEVSNTGKVRSLNYGGHGGVRELKPTKDHKGYLRVRITQHGKSRTVKVHRLVAAAFIPNPDNKPEVNHKDGNKEKNYEDNLEWSTESENTLHAYATGLKEATREHCRKMGQTIGKHNLAKAREERKTPIVAIRASDGEVFVYQSQAEAAAGTGAAQSNINKALKEKRKTANGFFFRYTEVMK